MIQEIMQVLKSLKLNETGINIDLIRVYFLIARGSMALKVHGEPNTAPIVYYQG